MPFSFSRLSLPLHHSAHSYGCCYHLYGPSSQICISSSDSLQVPDSWIPLLLGKLRFKTELEMFSKHFFTLCPLSQLLLHKLGEFSFTTSLYSQTSDPPIFSFWLLNASPVLISLLPPLCLSHHHLSTRQPLQHALWSSPRFLPHHSHLDLEKLWVGISFIPLLEIFHVFYIFLKSQILTGPQSLGGLAPIALSAPSLLTSLYSLHFSSTDLSVTWTHTFLASGLWHMLFPLPRGTLTYLHPANSPSPLRPLP